MTDEGFPYVDCSDGKVKFTRAEPSANVDVSAYTHGSTLRIRRIKTAEYTALVFGWGEAWPPRWDDGPWIMEDGEDDDDVCNWGERYYQRWPVPIRGIGIYADDNH